MSGTERKPHEDWEDDASEPSGPALQDDETGRITLSLEGPPLTLPEALPPSNASARRSSIPDTAHLDAWSADRLRRSSLPPSMTHTASVFPAAAPANDTQHAQHPGDLDEGDLLALVGRARPVMAIDLGTEMAERFALGDYSGALRAAELLLGQDPNHALGQHYARESTAKLEQMYTSRLRGGALQVVVPASELAWLGLDPQVSALLAQIDGRVGYEALLTNSGMPRLWALRALVELLDARVIRLV